MPLGSAPLPEPVAALLESARGLARLDACLALLGWDQETGMPRAAAAERAAQRGELAELHHRRWISSEFGDRIEAAEEAAAQLDDERIARCVRELRRRRERKVRVPAALAEERTRVAAESQSVWQEARADDDYARFRPYLDRVLDVERRVAQAVAEPGQSLYDALIDEYEPGGRAQQFNDVFDTVRPAIIELVERYAPRCAEVDRSFLTRAYPTAAQEAFGRSVATAIGFDFERGAMAISAHPFCSSFGAPHDVRVTTRYAEHDLRTALFGLIHECGHALYEQGFDAEWAATPIANAESMGIHESQSRLWENIVGRGRPFWRHFYPQLCERFPAQLDGVDLDDFLRAVNVVCPSPIRVEADEVTYNLHILLRFDLEQRLVAGELSTADLPEAWNQLTRDTLGFTPANDAEGVLQDIHWSFGAFGYFPTYFLGNLYAAQIHAAACAQLGDLDDAIGRGEFAPLREWLREQVHRLGSVYSADEICRRVTGAALDPQHFIDYIRAKLEDLHGA